jgi:hypothetical protein
LHDHVGMKKSFLYLVNLTLSVFTEKVDDLCANHNDDKLDLEVNDCDELGDNRKKLVSFNFVSIMIFY